MGTRFIDLVIIEVHGGKGGDGIVSFRREAHVPRGGPNGGDGGSGGSVILMVDRKLTTLADFRNGAIFRAKRGASGGPNNRTGGRGADLVLRVPPGTVVCDADTGELLGDLTEDGQKLMVAGGGMPGRGNASFATSRIRAPRKATRGEAGESRRIRLELSLLADAGLIGIPNAGKSTLLSAVSAARPRIADYPFTTIDPALGMVRMDRGFSFVLADLPGLLEGASEGVGLGLQFLRHVERTSILIYVLGLGLEMTPAQQFRTVREEVMTYKPELEKLEEMVVISKADLVSEDEMEEVLATLPEGSLCLSAVTGAGIPSFLAEVAERVRRLRSGADG